MIRMIGAALGLVCLLAACQRDDGFTPDGLPGRGIGVAEAVDGLAVGHRLMAAGEFELRSEEHTSELQSRT